MSFFLYPANAEKEDRIRITLTGKDGLVARYLSLFSEEETPFSWGLCEEDLLRELGLPEAVPGSRIVLEMKSEKGISEHQVIALRGQSDVDHTELAIVCRALVPDSGDHRQGEWVEALALTGGTTEGRYFWTRPKMDIGATIRRPTTSLQPS
ncbi:MAG: hypothetical protein LAT55_09745 [Opitutales bacterium]|nr:hypothetical protein [Opitutales bacterium]